MIRTVHIITDLTTGGAEMMLYKLLSCTDQSRFDCVVISLVGKGTLGERIEALNIPVHTIRMSGGRPSLTGLWRLVRLLHSLRPDVVQGWMYHGNIAATIALLLSTRNVPILWNIRHSLYDLKFEKKSTARIIRIGAVISRICTKIIYNSRISAVQHEKQGYAAERTTVIPNGFDCTRFKASPADRIVLRQELAISDNDIVIGLISRYHQMKDHNNFFEAAGILTRKYNNVHFVLAGRDINLDNIKIRESINKHNIIDQVHLLGERTDIAEINASLDIACSASAYGEAFPNVIGEAMACGVPCVATDVGDSAWIISETGKVVPPRDAMALAEAWCCLIEAGPDARIRLGNNARQRILDNFTLDKIVQQYEILYESVSC